MKLLTAAAAISLLCAAPAFAIPNAGAPPIASPLPNVMQAVPAPACTLTLTGQTPFGVESFKVLTAQSTSGAGESRMAISVTARDGRWSSGVMSASAAGTRFKTASVNCRTESISLEDAIIVSFRPAGIAGSSVPMEEFTLTGSRPGTGMTSSAAGSAAVGSAVRNTETVAKSCTLALDGGAPSPIDSFRYGVSHSGAGGSAGSGAAHAPTEIIVTMRENAGSPKIFEAASSGKVFKNAVIACKSETVTLSNATVSSFRTGADGSSDRPTSEVTLVAQKVEVSH
jgi:type VI protein secretion system component Hcp